MVGTITTDEKDAIARWLAAHAPTHCPLGKSGMYDEQGRPFAETKRAMSKLATRIRKVRGYKKMRFSVLAQKLRTPEVEIRAAWEAHQIG